jgi:hypothetical protein
MTAFSFTNKKSRLIAAGFAIAYILVQCFQEYVFRVIPVPANSTEELLQGAMHLHIWRSMLLLLSFFTLIYIFFVICLQNFRKNPTHSFLAFLGFLIFCFLEIGIRSVEFFYIQLQMPADFLQAKDDMLKNSIIDKYLVFQSVQAALYFPLMLSQAIASLIVAISYSGKPKINLLIKVALAINAIRLTGRLSAMTFHISWFDSFSGILYIPFVIVIFGLISVWLIKIKDENITS